MQPRRAALFAVVALVAVACGGDDSGDTDSGAAPPPSSTTTVTMAAPAPPAEVEVPEVSLTDVASGEEVSLASLVPSERPVLFWFWAPH
jgi:hypothetical protein